MGNPNRPNDYGSEQTSPSLPTADELFEKYKKERESNFAKTEFTEKEVDMISTELKNILEFREEKADFNNGDDEGIRYYARVYDLLRLRNESCNIGSPKLTKIEKEGKTQLSREIRDHILSGFSTRVTH